MPGVVLVNPHSGPDETSPSEIAARFPGSAVHEIDGHAVRRQVEEAIAGATSPAFVAVAGGDGTIRCAAGVVAGTDLPLLAIPAGTRNHFAREVGTPTLDDATAAADGEIVSIDVGEVNGEVFVNNANIGIYPRIVRDRTEHQKRFSKQTATLVATWQQVRSIHKFTVTIDEKGASYRAWMVFVGNGRYGSSLLDLGDRETLDDGILDVRILRADGRLARLRVALALLSGRMERSPMTVFDEVRSITLSIAGRPKVDVALDGELVSMSTPLSFRCRAGALRVLVPRSASTAAS
ncbi:MAG TPA: diacylglycerol kinase family protein [Acidimicrobiales bacterium]|nr:diacylglycerol kinase family protein [Acidimicrobiales bacterium]